MVAKASEHIGPSRPKVFIVIESVSDADYRNRFHHGPFLCEHEANAYAHALVSEPNRGNMKITARVTCLECWRPELIGMKKSDFASNYCGDCGLVRSECECECDDEGCRISDEEDENDE